MCSNNTSNNVRVRGVAHASGIVGDRDDYGSSSLRKAKKQRIPKRGPGVAELEKILREQEENAGVENGKIIGPISSSLVPSLPNTYPHPYSSFASSSISLPGNVSFLGNTQSTPPLPPVTTLHVNGNGDLKGSSLLGCGNVGGNGRSKGVYIGGSGVFLPEQTLLPITWGSSETRKGEEAPKMAIDFSFPAFASNGSDHNKMFPPPMLQKNHGPCHPSLMNLFPRSAISSSSTPSSPSSAAAGVYHHVEPPSNQKSCHNYTETILPEEDKIIGFKPPRPNFPVDNRPPAAPHMPCQPPSFHPRISRLDPSPSTCNNGVFNLGTATRDHPMPTSPLELKVKTCVNDHGRNPSGNDSALPLTLGSPTTPLPTTQNCQPDFTKFIKQFPFQEMKENTEGLQLQGSSSESEVPVHKKISFFSFLLQPEEQRGAAESTLGLKNEKYCTEIKGDFIDLNLKL